MSDDYYSWQAKKQRRESEKSTTMPVRCVYPEPKKDRRKPKEKR